MKRILDDLNIFCAVVEAGSLKGASQKLAVPHSTVSRRIEALEKSLGLVLLHRTTREVKVTSRGLEIYQDCAALISSVNQSVNQVIEAEIRFKGTMRVSLPVRAGLDFLGSWLIDFAARHNDLKMDIRLSNTNKNLVKDDIDLAFRVGPLADSSAIAIRLWDIPYTVCAHPDFLQQQQMHQQSISSQQLQQLPCVISMPATNWHFVCASGKEHIITPQTSLTVDDLSLAMHAAQTGQYLAMMPSSMIEQSELIPIKVENLQPRTRVMYAYYLGRRHPQSQIKHLIDYIRGRYEQ